VEKLLESIKKAIANQTKETKAAGEKCSRGDNLEKLKKKAGCPKTKELLAGLFSPVDHTPCSTLNIVCLMLLFIYQILVCIVAIVIIVFSYWYCLFFN
jgi:hypothetical protein